MYHMGHMLWFHSNKIPKYSLSKLHLNTIYIQPCIFSILELQKLLQYQIPQRSPHRQSNLLHLTPSNYIVKEGYNFYSKSNWFFVKLMPAVVKNFMFEF